MPRSDNPPSSADASSTIPVIAEDLRVDTVAQTTGAVRVRIEASERPQRLDLEEWVEEVAVERVPCNRPADERQPQRTEGETLVIPVYEEVVTVQRRLMLKEELHVTRRRRAHPVQAEAVLREERAVVERRQADGTWRPEEGTQPLRGNHEP
jgi:uncharacterized protein (TIGR02271 family)